MRGGAADPSQVRDWMSFAEAYGPVVDQNEALAHFIHHSIGEARYQAGNGAPDHVYALAKRLAKQPATADLAPYVADMRRALGNRGGKPKPAPDTTPDTPHLSGHARAHQRVTPQ